MIGKPKRKTAANSAYRLNLFVGSKVTVPNIAGTDVETIQETDYPWSGSVTITVNPKVDKSSSIRVRVPDREVSDIYHNEPEANGILSIKVNGRDIRPPFEKGYAVIDQAWKAGDRIHLELPMQVQRVRAIDKIEATRGEVALRFGPLIYSVETVDQKLDGALSPDTPLIAEWRPDLLQGVLAIPNYARANRFKSSGDEGENDCRDAGLKVWIKESRD